MDENVAYALKMAAAVLIFVMALTVWISSFGRTRRAAQDILELNDREYEDTYVENANSTKRIVGAETIIPSIYRAYDENYKIFFVDEHDNPIWLFTKTEYDVYQKREITEGINYIDLRQESLGDDAARYVFVKAVIYGKQTIIDPDEKASLATIEGSRMNLFTKNETSSIIEGEKLCDIIGTTKFEESLGEYYEQDLEEEPVNDSTVDSVPEANKTKKRVITYKKIP